MSGRLTHVIVCDNCQAHFYPSPIVKALCDVREQAAAHGWAHRIVVLRRGISPSLDFCRDCVCIEAPAVVENRIRQDRAS